MKEPICIAGAERETMKVVNPSQQCVIIRLWDSLSVCVCCRFPSVGAKFRLGVYIMLELQGLRGKAAGLGTNV